MLKHTDDDGDLSIFASGDELLLVCAQGHYWVVNASLAKSGGGAPGEDGRPAMRDMNDLTERFGKDVRRALR